MTRKEISISTDSAECSCLRIELFFLTFVREGLCERLAFAVYKLQGLIPGPIVFCVIRDNCLLRDGGIRAFCGVGSLYLFFLHGAGFLDSNGSL